MGRLGLREKLFVSKMFSSLPSFIFFGHIRMKPQHLCFDTLAMLCLFILQWPRSTVCSSRAKFLSVRPQSASRGTEETPKRNL